jgi:anti-anti-sigma regulatory factor
MSIDLVVKDKKPEFEVLSNPDNDSYIVVRPSAIKLEAPDFTLYHDLINSYSEKDIIFDMINIQQANSNTISFLIVAYKNLEERGNKFRICNCHDKMKKYVEITHTQNIFSDYEKSLDQVLDEGNVV